MSRYASECSARKICESDGQARFHRHFKHEDESDKRSVSAGQLISFLLSQHLHPLSALRPVRFKAAQTIAQFALHVCTFLSWAQQIPQRKDMREDLMPAKQGWLSRRRGYSHPDMPRTATKIAVWPLPVSARMHSGLCKVRRLQLTFPEHSMLKLRPESLKFCLGQTRKSCTPGVKTGSRVHFTAEVTKNRPARMLTEQRAAADSIRHSRPE